MIGDLLISYCKKHLIGKEKLDDDFYEFVFEFEESDLHKFREKEFLFEAPKGGLVLGNLHSEGGIQLVRPFGNNKFKHVGEMEGWEYLTSPVQWTRMQELFEHLNSEKLDDPSTDTCFEIPESCDVIDTRGSDVPILLLPSYHNRIIINRFATKKHLTNIMQLDIVNSFANFQLDKINEEFLS